MKEKLPSHFLIPTGLFKEVLGVLKQRPWGEVAGLMVALDQCEPFNRDTPEPPPPPSSE